MRKPLGKDLTQQSKIIIYNLQSILLMIIFAQLKKLLKIKDEI